MNNLYLVQALQQINNPNILVNVISQRVRQLGQGHRALVVAEAHLSYLDIALKEVAEGKLSYELGETVVARSATPAKGRRRR